MENKLGSVFQAGRQQCCAPLYENYSHKLKYIERFFFSQDYRV